MTEKGKSFLLELNKLGVNEKDAINNKTQGVTTNYITVGPKEYFLNEYYMDEAEGIYNLELRADDIFVTTFPKSGTIWIQELVWLLQNNLDFEKAKSIPLNDRFPYLQITTANPSERYDKENPISLRRKAFGSHDFKGIAEFPSPRFVKSHLPLSLLPPTLLDTTKVVYVARDPRDVAVSMFYNLKLVKFIHEDSAFKPLWNLFIKSLVPYTPYFAHVLEAWEKRHHTNLLFLFYEELLKNLPESIRRVAQFLGKEVTEQQVKDLDDHLKFDNFKNNKSVNLQEYQEKGVFRSEGSFVRKGKAGGWVELFDDEMTAQADKWIEDNVRDTDFKFPHM